MFEPYLDSNSNIKKLTSMKRLEIWILSGFLIFKEYVCAHTCTCYYGTGYVFKETHFKDK